MLNVEDVKFNISEAFNGEEDNLSRQAQNSKVKFWKMILLIWLRVWHLVFPYFFNKSGVISEGILNLDSFSENSKPNEPDLLNLIWYRAQCYRRWLFNAPLFITLKIKIWVVAYLKFIFFSKYQKKIFHFMQLFSADATIM